MTTTAAQTSSLLAQTSTEVLLEATTRLLKGTTDAESQALATTVAELVRRGVLAL